MPQQAVRDDVGVAMALEVKPRSALTFVGSEHIEQRLPHRRRR